MTLEIEDEKRFEKLMEMLRTREAPASAPTLPNPASAIDYVEGVDGEEFMCSPDECSRLVSEMKKANLIKDNRAGLMKTYKNSFKGQDLVDWLIAEKKLGQLRVAKQYIRSCRSQTGIGKGPGIDRSTIRPADIAQDRRHVQSGPVLPAVGGRRESGAQRRTHDRSQSVEGGGFQRVPETTDARDIRRGARCGWQGKNPHSNLPRSPSQWITSDWKRASNSSVISC
jgi:hypothetical protein